MFEIIAVAMVPMAGKATAMSVPAAWKSWITQRRPRSSSSSISIGFEGHNTAEFTMLPQGSDTRGPTTVTWRMHGPAPFISKLMQVLMNFDHMVSKDFETGLANLKRLAER